MPYFCGIFSRILTFFLSFPRFGILGAVFLVMSYFIDFLLFKMKHTADCNISISV